MSGIARDRRRWSWKGSETAELARGSGMAELARDRPGDGGSLPESGRVSPSRAPASFAISELWPAPSSLSRRRDPPTADLFCGSETTLGTADLARARRRRSWKGLGDGRASPGIGDGEPARAQRRRNWPELLFLFVYWGFRARQLLMDRKQRSWKGLGNGGLARGPETAELFRGSETAELARAPTCETAKLFWGSEPRRSWLGLGDGGTSQC